MSTNKKMSNTQLYDDLCANFEILVRDELKKDPTNKNFLNVVNNILNYNETIFKSTINMLYKKDVSADALKDLVRKMHKSVLTEINTLLAEEDKL